MPPRSLERVPPYPGDESPLPVLCRFPDLKAAGIVDSWAQLRNQIERENFPRGVMLSKNCRAWLVREIEEWLATRPSAPKAVNVEKAKKTRLQRKESIAEATTT
jgi:predicted DNA-binding transcriptional regulator AlpA